MINREPEKALEILDFWFSAGMEKWFGGGEAFDEECHAFGPLWEEASNGALDEWSNSAAGCLALIILTDQIPRNIFRGDAKQFSTDAKAVTLARHAIAAGFDKSQMMPGRSFFYLPFMHSEDLDDQRLCCDLFREYDGGEQYKYALIHMDAIARFGHFPHRNEMLGRDTTDAERHYLETGGFGA